ncbi:MAG: hypothetical protein ACRC64_09585 [Plesiomonas shigelloides]
MRLLTALRAGASKKPHVLHWLKEQGMLALCASGLFGLSYFLLMVAVWMFYPSADELASGWVKHLSPSMFMDELRFDFLLGGLFYPLFLLIPRHGLLALFSVLWFWQLYELAFYYQDVGTSTWSSVLYADIAPYSVAILFTLLPALAALHYIMRWQHCQRTHQL